MRELHVATREPVSLDPAFLSSNNDFVVAVNVHEALFAIDPASGKAMPGLAVEHSADEQLRVWTFKLDGNARYSDGTPVKAEDFVFAWNRIVSPSTASPGADAMYVMRNAREIAAGKGGELGVTAVDTLTLKVELSEPQPFLPELLASPRFAPVPRNTAPAQDTFRSGKGVSSGPYQIADWQNGKSMTLIPNLQHAGGGKGCFDKVVLHFTDSEETALKWFETGNVDLVSLLVPLGRIARIKEKYGRQLVEQPMRSEFYFIMNLAKPPLDNLDLRRAVFAGIDRRTLVRRILGAGQQEAWGFIPPYYSSSIGYDAPACPAPPDSWKRPPSSSAAALSGQELASNSSESLKAILEFVQQSILKETGIFLSIRLMEWNSFLAALKNGDFAVSRLSLTGGPDPIDFLDNFTSGHPNNFSGFGDADFDALVGKAHQAGTAQERFDLMNQAHEILCRKLPAVPVYFSTQVHLVREPLVQELAHGPEGWVVWRME